MANHARIEELSDSDSDPDIMDISTIANNSAPSRSTSLIDPANIPTTAQPAPSRPAFDPNKAKRWHCLYPIYFDAAKTRQEGRRVGKEQAVKNPLARTIVDAVAQLGLNVVFEATKMHPKDWANPGRIKIELKGEDGKLKRGSVKNKHHLYLLVSSYLKSHPTTVSTPMEFPIRGMPLPDEPPPPPAAPRGWKMNEILPLHSPAVSGGGVNDDMLKEMMDQMGGGPGAAAGGSGKKQKKKIIRV